MRSIKPGRMPSMMGAMMALFMVVFGIVWTGMASSLGGGFFAVFGVAFVLIGIAIFVINMKNAFGKNRYSAFDITGPDEERDPLEDLRGPEERSYSGGYCPYCGAKAQQGYEFCRSCGKRLP